MNRTWGLLNIHVTRKLRDVIFIISILFQKSIIWSRTHENIIFVCQKPQKQGNWNYEKFYVKLWKCHCGAKPSLAKILWGFSLQFHIKPELKIPIYLTKKQTNQKLFVKLLPIWDFDSPHKKKRTNVNDNEQWKVLLYCVIPHWLFSVCWRGWNEIFVWLIYRQKSMWKLITLTFIGIDSRQTI